MAKERLSKPIDARTMYHKGESFHFSARYCQRGGLPALGGAWCAWPTNLAFACEAYLKVLAQLERNEPPFETHNLRDLFHDVTPTTQRALRKRWLKENGQMLKQKPMRLPVKIKNAKTFEEALDLSAKAFVDWRYNESSPNHWQLGTLPEILREHLLTCEPDWRPPKGLVASVLNPHPDFIKPQTYVKSAFPAGWSVFNNQSAPVDVKVGRSSDAKDSSPGKRS